MSVFDLPRLHFAGTATTHLPTGPRGGVVDFATNTALTPAGQPFDVDQDPARYHEQLGPAKGDCFNGSGYFAVDAALTGVETSAGLVDTADPVVGRNVDMWGHYNEYLATTANRARVFDVDPASNWTTALMVGQFCFGRLGRSHDVEYMFIGDVAGTHPPRWQDSRGGWSTTYQFAITGDEAMAWQPDAALSPALGRMREVLDRGDFAGLVVQFALAGPPVQDGPGRPHRWRIWGTVAPWRPDELRSYPAGRLLVPRRQGGWPSPVTVSVGPDDVTVNLVGAASAWAGLRDRRLELRTAGTDRLVAKLDGAEPAASSGILTVARSAVADELLQIVAGGEILLREKEINVQTDSACLILDHPGGPEGAEVEVTVRSYRRGRPCAVDGIQVTQFFNPRALPLDPAASGTDSRRADVTIAEVRNGHQWSATGSVRTNADGVGSFGLRGARAGCTRLLLSADAADQPCPPDTAGSAAIGYDNEDELGYWSGAGTLALRVLPDDWRLDRLDRALLSHDLLYREVFAYYELLFSFMKDEVFSLAEQCKVGNYTQLIWQMCDPRNKDRTYYMPPTRDLSAPKARLLLDFLRARRVPDVVPEFTRSPRRSPEPITDRDELVATLRQAAAIELTVMVQYLYAAYSIPTYGAGEHYVRQGVWTAAELAMLCGDGGETTDGGVRAGLIEVAREEMIHFLLVNNILLAVGEAFHVPAVDFGTVNVELPVPVDFSLERLDLGSVRRFMAIEQPEDMVPEVRRSDLDDADHLAPRPGARTLSELYARIREGLLTVPDLFLVRPGEGGGEHHLFLRRAINHRHPDYQLEVDDVDSALFAIDVITEQGEGGVLAAQPADEPSHYDTFARMAEVLTAAERDPRRSWSPSYPVVRNPTLRSDSPAHTPVTAPTAREVMGLFNEAYFIMMQLIVQHFGESAAGSLRRSVLMNSAIEVMNGVMRPLSELLVTLPSGVRGRTAGPSFELDAVPSPVPRPDVARRLLVRRLGRLAEGCAKCPVVPGGVTDSVLFLADLFRRDA